MNWQETVIKLDNVANESLRIQMVKILEKQAEISFKAGQDSKNVEAGWVKLADDQSLPDIPPLTTRHDDPQWLDGWLRDMAKRTQQDMLKNNFRKIEKVDK